jgi:hypothetical protein
MAYIMEGVGRLGTGLYLGYAKPAVGRYEFAIDGGAVGPLVLRGDQLPAGAIIVDTLINVETALTGGTVTDTVQLGSEGAADLQSAAARNASPWSTATPKRGTLTATAVPVRTTARRNLTMTINGTALTGGKLAVVVWYIEF